MWWLMQVGRASSRLLNAIRGGEGDTTFSAYSDHLLLAGSRWGRLRVALVDRLLGKNHCLKAWAWHASRRLFEIEK